MSVHASVCLSVRAVSVRDIALNKLKVVSRGIEKLAVIKRFLIL